MLPSAGCRTVRPVADFHVRKPSGRRERGAIPYRQPAYRDGLGHSVRGIGDGTGRWIGCESEPLRRHVGGRKEVMKLTFGRFLGLAALFVPVTLPVQVAVAEPCPDIGVVFARGTYEPAGVGLTGQAFVDAIRARAASGPSRSTRGVRGRRELRRRNRIRKDGGGRNPGRRQPYSGDGGELSEHQNRAGRYSQGRWWPGLSLRLPCRIRYPLSTAVHS